MSDREKLLEAVVEVLSEALQFYADPEIYHAVAFFFDLPTGGYEDDFGGPEEHRHPLYGRDMPGKTARAALNKAQEIYNGKSCKWRIIEHLKMAMPVAKECEGAEAMPAVHTCSICKLPIISA